MGEELLAERMDCIKDFGGKKGGPFAGILEYIDRRKFNRGGNSNTAKFNMTILTGRCAGFLCLTGALPCFFGPADNRDNCGRFSVPINSSGKSSIPLNNCGLLSVSIDKAGYSTRKYITRNNVLLISFCSECLAKSKRKRMLFLFLSYLIVIKELYYNNSGAKIVPYGAKIFPLGAKIFSYGAKIKFMFIISAPYRTS